jgi:hypothetical protein
MRLRIVDTSALGVMTIPCTKIAVSRLLFRLSCHKITGAEVPPDYGREGRFQRSNYTPKKPGDGPVCKAESGQLEATVGPLD